MVHTAPLKWLLFGLSSTSLGILSLIWTPFEIIMEERLRMRPGLPSFDWWYDPPDVIRLKFYLFNVTNADRYMSGEDEKLKIEEVGPIVFREVVTHRDAVFNDNSTLSYTVYRNAVWDDSLNTIDLNATLMYPNLPVLLTASMFWDTNYLMKLVLNSAFEVTGSQPIVRKTIYEILYNNTDPFLNVAHITAPYLANHPNIGLIPLIYPGYGIRMNVLIGTKFGHKRFFFIDKFNGSIHIPGRGSKCRDNLLGATNNIIHSQFKSRTDRINVFNNLMCRSLILRYEEDVDRQGFQAYKFVLDRDAYNRMQPAEDDCYKSTPPLTDGLTDLAACWFEYPVVGSFPHFLYNEKLARSVDGLKPNVDKHRSYAIFEPISGIALTSMASMQVNIYMKPLQNLHKIFQRFNDMIIPIFWMETSHESVPDYIAIFIRVMLALPSVGTIITVLLFVFGTYCTWKLHKHFSNGRKQGSQEEILKTKEARDVDVEEVFVRNETGSQRVGE